MLILSAYALLPLCWFHYGLPAALACSVFLLLLLILIRAWRVLPVALAVTVFSLCLLELQFSGVLPFENQHGEANLTVCTDLPAKIYQDSYSVKARVVTQPDGMQMQNILLTLPHARVNGPPKPGSCLEGIFRLRSPLGFVSPGGFLAEKYYFSKRISAKGTLLSLASLEFLPSFPQDIYDRRKALFDDDTSLAIWSALVFGWSSGMDSKTKSLFSDNQIMHLFVISGMHIGFIFLLISLTIYYFVRPFSWCFQVSQTSRYWLALVCVAIYVWLIGWPIPAARALIMIALPIGVHTIGVRLSWLSSMQIAMVLLVAVMPEAWLSLGAWLSFISVYLILFLLRWRLLPEHWLSRLLVFQCVMSLSVLPWAFGAGFPVNFLAGIINFFLAPVIGFVLLPMAFLIWLIPVLPVVRAFEWGLSQLLWLLDWLAGFAQTLPWLSVLEVALICLLLAFSVWHRDRVVRFSLILFSSVLMILSAAESTDKARYPAGRADITLYDVGHGLAVTIEDEYGLWLIDTGGGYRSGVSYFERYLDRQIGQLNGILITHSDTDHAAAAAYINRTRAPLMKWSGQPEELQAAPDGSGYKDCHHSGPVSQSLSFISIPDSLRNSDNNQSCIILYEIGSKRIIITGDADIMVEYYLLQSYPELFPGDLIVLGHHGSGSSSSTEWLERNRGSLFLVSTGSRAAPRWPARRIALWFEKEEESLLTTAERGTIRATIHADGIDIRSWDTAYRKRLIN